jgi:hypothetical protein
MFYLGRYLLATWSYGAVSAVPHTWKLEREYRHTQTWKKELLPVPIAERVGIALFRMGVAPAWWPMLMYKDLTRLELYCKGIDPRKYGINPDETIF